MFKHNLFTLLAAFSPREIERFNKFLASPYFNGSKKILNLYKEIIRYYPSFLHENLTKRNLALSITASGRYNDSTLRNSLAELLKLAQKFVTVEAGNSYEFASSSILIKELMRRNAFKLLLKELNVFSRGLALRKEDSEFFYYAYCYETIKFNSGMLTGNILHSSEAVSKAENLTASALNLLKFFTMEMTSLQLNFNALKSKYNFNEENLPGIIHEKMNIPGIAEYLSGTHEGNIFNLYRALFKMAAGEENDILYREYKDTFEKYINKLTAGEAVFHFYCLINYCIRRKKTAAAESNYDMELLDIYEMFLKGEYFKDERTQYITPDLYRDILLLYLKCGRFNRAKEFIERYIKALPPAEVKNIYEYSYMNYFFATGSLTEALKRYNRLKVNDFVFKFDVKNIVIKCFYGLGYLEEALQEIKNYREFLRNNRNMIPGKKIERFRRFLWYTEKLVLFKTGSDISPDYLLKKLLDEKNVAFKKWLIEKYSDG
jgi:hypothetical protein